MSTFKIDFFEFAFLVEACIPPRPIARTMFWHNVIDKFYHEMSSSERVKLFEWITKDRNFDLSNDDARWFYDRYNPDNQYLIETTEKGKKTVHKVFKHNIFYCTSRKSFILNEFITNYNVKDEDDKKMDFNVDSY